MTVPSPTIHRSKNQGLKAFSLLELLALLAVLLLVAAFFLPAVLRQRHPPAHRIKCVSNLKNISLAFRIYAVDNNDHFPAPHLSNAVAVASLTAPTHFSFLHNELSTPRLLFCPSEKSRKAAGNFIALSNQNISYFSSVSTDASAIPEETIFPTRLHLWLAGDRHLIINGTPAQPGQVTLSPNDQVSWSRELHEGNGNVAMADGSVQQFTSPALQQSLSSHTATNRLLFP